MSFVLDALKLSEKRRSRFARPAYAHPPRVHRGGGRRRWYAVLAAAPIVAGVFLAWRLLVPPSPAPLPATADGADVFAAAGLEAAPANAAAAAMSGPEESKDPDPATPADAPSASRAEEQPSADELPLEMAPPDWPALTLQMLFYSPDRGRRFVQINGRNYRVGERLDDGPEVLEIAPHGVTLAHQGKKVLLAMDR